MIFLKSLADSMASNTGNYTADRKKFYEWYNTFDQRRNLNLVETFPEYKDFYEKAQKEDVSVAQYLLQFVEIQRKAVGHYGDLLAKYKIAETTKELLEFDQHIADV
jgi:hypothetical protein